VAAEPPSLLGFCAYFVRLGTLGFGGPIALAGYMQRDLVEERRWIARQDYLEGLALAQLAPGPLAAQLAIYLGWVRARVPGATLVGLAFVLPSFLMVMGLSALYLRFGGLPWMQGVFYGIGAAVIAIIGRSATKLVRLTLGGDRLLWAIFAFAAVVTAWTESEVVWLFVGGGLVALAVRTVPSAAFSLLPLALVTGLHGAAARRDERLERFALVARVTLDYGDHGGNEIVPPFELDVDVGPGVVAQLAETREPVERQHHPGDDDDADQADPHHGRQI